MEQQLQAIVMVLSLVNPLICAAMFMEIEVGQPHAARMADATKAAIAVAIILVVAALVGGQVLELFGVSLDAFAVAGGAVLVWIGFSMLRGDSPKSEQQASDSAESKRSITPLILFAASPGTITGVITLAVAHSKKLLPVSALVAVVVGAFVMWIVMAFAVGGRTPKARSLFRDTTTRFMGLIVVAMGVQFVLTALQNFFDRRS